MRTKFKPHTQHTMKNLQIIAIAALTCLTINVNAQIKSPAPSPGATINQTVGLVDIEVNYSRPGKKDRVIFGKLVPYGEVWRTGANAATKIKFDEKINIGGKDVDAGEYSIYTIPGEAEWTIIISKNKGSYDKDEYNMEEDDAARFTVKPAKLTDLVETFTIDFSSLTNNGANMDISWENTRVSIPIKVYTDEAVMAAIQSTIIDGPSAGDYRQAARYYLQEEKELETALEWINKAIEKKSDAFWYVYNKAEILAKLGKKKDAIAAAEKSMEMAKAYEDGDFGYIKRNEELIAKVKGKK